MMVLYPFQSDAHPGPFEPYYLVNKQARLYIGQFSSFTHAYVHWRRLRSEDWFILSTDDARKVMTRPSVKRWLKLEEPCELKKVPPNSVYPGRKNGQNRSSPKRTFGRPYV